MGTIPRYFDYLIAAQRRGTMGRCAHLGYWDAPPEGAPLPADPWTAQEFARAQERLDERLLAMADLRPGQAVLDAGCGFGGTLEAINGREVRMRLTGVNIDPRQLEVCREIRPREGNRIEWLQADACALPVAEASIDRVFCVEAMFHFPSRRAFFREAARVLAPGGALIGTDITLTPSARAQEAPAFPLAALLLEGYGPWPDLWSDDADHRALAEAAGLTCVAHEDATAQTAPSHQFTAPAGADLRHVLASGDANPALCAALALKWLHEGGHLRYTCFRFDKPGRAA